MLRMVTAFTDPLNPEYIPIHACTMIAIAYIVTIHAAINIPLRETSLDTLPLSLVPVRGLSLQSDSSSNEEPVEQMATPIYQASNGSEATRTWE